MKTIIVLVGVRGSGKSTQLAKVKNFPGIKILQPSTSRAARADDDGQYHYQNKEAWNKDHFAWTIEAGNQFYGLRKAELESLKLDEIGLTVFHPGTLKTLYDHREKSLYEFITVGLDTVGNYEELKERIQNDASRDEGVDEFKKQKEIVQNCDAALTGDANIIFGALVSIFRICKARGVLGDQCICDLIRAGTLLKDAPLENIQPASYDFTVGNTVWCKGKRTDLQPNQAISIPPYSYVIVQAEQLACLPKFIIAHYDLALSLFVQGIILSNGPQVDPGYEGALSCMLFNGSDLEVPLKRGDHFATIEFLVTNRVTKGYAGHHQHKKAIEQFMGGRALLSSGGTILEQIATVKKSWEDFRNVVLLPTVFSMAALFIGIVTAAITIGIWAHDITEKTGDATDKAEMAGKQASEISTNLSNLIDEEKRLEKNVNDAVQDLRNQQRVSTNPIILPSKTTATNTVSP